MLVPLVLVGAYHVGCALTGSDLSALRAAPKAPLRTRSPAERIGVPPGPPRPSGKAEFHLDKNNATQMNGRDDPVNERWADLAGNYYADGFVREFSYERTGPDAPRVLVQVDPTAPTFRGRIELHGMKPNFAYQLKLRGDYQADPQGFEHIGYAGRWRLPGGDTNFTDQQYREYPEKENVEAYILFDYVVTDARGEAVRDFALDSSLHVLWNATRQTVDAKASEVTPFIIDATDPAVYACPKPDLAVEQIWAEPESRRYQKGQTSITLPPGHYHAQLVLTEESWHAFGNDDGYWATVAACNMRFEVR